VKIKLDENLPERLVPALTVLGHDMDTVRAERLNGQTDPRVWSATQAAQRFFVTQDLDFSDMRRFTPGTHAGLLLVRLTRPGREASFERVVKVFQTEKVEDWTGCLVVVTDRKVRVRRPAQTTER
jgi:predicted nuclease of predicted toxin-antitoxin system